MRVDLLKVLVCAAAVLVCSSAYAGPQSGFSVNVGIANQQSKFVADNETDSGIGGSLGVDYQQAVSDHFSVLALLMVSSDTELFSKRAVINVTSQTLLGAEGRFWMGNFFVGAHVGRYNDGAVFDFFGHPTKGGTVNGWGWTAGWEGRGRMYVVGQIDKADGMPVSASSSADLLTYRVSIGYRWK